MPTRHSPRGSVEVTHAVDEIEFIDLPRTASPPRRVPVCRGIAGSCRQPMQYKGSGRLYGSNSDLRLFECINCFSRCSVVGMTRRVYGHAWFDRY
jgi:hypothetical protein